MDKKGSGEAKQVGLMTELIMGIIVVGILFYVVQGIYTNEEFDSLYFEKDVSLIMNTLESLPADIELNYTFKGRDYDFFVGEGEIVISEAEGVLHKSKVFIFAKKGKKVFVSQPGLELIELTGNG